MVNLFILERDGKITCDDLKMLNKISISDYDTNNFKKIIVY